MQKHGYQKNDPNPKLPKEKLNVTKGGDKLQAAVNKVAEAKKVK